MWNVEEERDVRIRLSLCMGSVRQGRNEADGIYTSNVSLRSGFMRARPNCESDVGLHHLVDWDRPVGKPREVHDIYMFQGVLARNLP